MKRATLVKKLLALALCAMLFVGLLPGTAQAADPAAYYDDITGDFCFYNYAQLKNELGKGMDYLCAVYKGSGALTITQSLTLKAHLELTAKEVIIPKGVTVTIQEGLSGGNVAKLTVNGTLVNKESSLFLSTLAVNGSLVNDGWVACDSLLIQGSVQNNGTIDYTSISGREKIRYGAEGRLYVNRRINSVAQLDAVIAEAVKETDSHVEYSVLVTKNMTIDKSTNIPVNMTLRIGQFDGPAVTLTLAKGATLTNLGFVGLTSANARLSIRGSFVNHGFLYTHYGAKIALDGGTYQASDMGTLGVYLPYNDETGSYVGKPADYLPGFTMSSFSLEDSGEGSYVYSLKKTMSSNGWQKIGGDWYYFEDGYMFFDEWVKDSKGWCYLGADGKMARNTWKKDSKGWCYLGADGHISLSKWVKDGGKWYYLNASGYMVTGWQKIGGKQYYFASSGVMATGWQKVSGTWYFFKDSGVMAADTWAKDSKGWCYLGSNGKMVTNTWKKDSKGWCYLGSDGRMSISKWVKDGGKWYYMNASGYMTTGWQKLDGKWYYMDASGVMKTGWLKDGGKWYYLDTNGVMVTGTKTINGKSYTFNSSGICQNP